ncbi:MAG: UvrD-helicase domain-containing protein [candidate division WOR-3 bacterium]
MAKKKGTVVLDKDTNLKFPHILIIDASAGTGKTHTLAQRYVQYILSQVIPYNTPSNILAITFTNNAAREMKQRILDWLKKLALGIDCEEKRQTLELVSLSPEQIKKQAKIVLDNILKHWSDFHIQTIDSFMSRILRSSAHEIGIPLETEITESYEVLVDSALAIIFKDVEDRAVQEELEQFLELLNQESNTFAWNPQFRIIEKFTEFLKEEGKVLEKIIFEDSFAEINKRLALITEIYQKVVELGFKDKIKKTMQEAVEQSNIKELIGGFDRVSLWFNKKQLNALDESVENICKELPQIIEELTVLYSNSHYFHYGIFYEKFKKALNIEKRKNEIIHFDDINKILSEYIRRDNVPEVYYRLGDTLYHFMLDEFQDTDRVQWENIQPLLFEAYSKGGSFFAVGDMKQAIYLFRKADYRIMRNIVQKIRFRDSYESSYLPDNVIDNARIIPLEENFRSGNVILTYVDNIFKNKLKQIQDVILLKEDRTGLTDYVQTTKKKYQGYVKTIVLNKSEEELEKDALLEIINDVLKRYQPRDIAILAHKNRHIEKIVEWLTEKSIDTASFSSLNIKKRKIIMEIVNLLQFLDSPIDNLSFATFITGDIFLSAVKSWGREIKREDILSFIMDATAQKSSGTNLYVEFRDGLEFSSLWQKFFEDIFNKVGYYPLYDLISEIYRTFKVFDNFKEEAGFLARFLEAISLIEAKGMNNIKDFLKLVAEEQEESVLNIMLPDYIDAVKVMTFHKAKGLGFPVVINMIYDEGGGPQYMFFDKEDEHLKIYYIIKGFQEKSAKLARIYSEKNLDELIQTLNLLYVANTRAMNELYNIVIKRDDRYHNAYTDLFEEFEDGEKIAPLERAISRPESTEIKIPEHFEIEFVEQEERNWSINRILETKKGEFFHEILAQIDFVGSDIDKKLDEVMKRVLTKSKEIYEFEWIKETILNFLNIDKAREWFNEKPGREVYQEIEYTNEQGLLYRIDRVVIDPESITIIDFKTGTDELDYYYNQLRNYIRIVKNLNPQKEVKGYIAFIETGKINEVK